MRTLTFSPKSTSEFECPPKDTYVLEVTEIGEFVEKGAFNDPDTINTQSRIEFQVVDFDYDPDEDDRNWNGVRVADFFVFFREFTNERGERVTSDTWRSEKSKAYELISALLGHKPEDGEDIDLQEYVGTRVKATVEPKPNGWPKITGFVPHRRKKRKAVVTEDDPFNEDAA